MLFCTFAIVETSTFLLVFFVTFLFYCYFSTHRDNATRSHCGSFRMIPRRYVRIYIVYGIESAAYIYLIRRFVV